jgi:hypothetical protein
MSPDSLEQIVAASSQQDVQNTADFLAKHWAKPLFYLFATPKKIEGMPVPPQLPPVSVSKNYQAQHVRKSREETKKIYYYYISAETQEELIPYEMMIDPQKYFTALALKEGLKKQETKPEPPKASSPATMILLKKKNLLETGVYSPVELKMELNPSMFAQDFLAYLTKQGVNEGYYFGAFYTGDQSSIMLTPEQKDALGDLIDNPDKGYPFHCRYSDSPKEMFSIFNQIKGVNGFIKCYAKVMNGAAQQTVPMRIQSEIKESPGQKPR